MSLRVVSVTGPAQLLLQDNALLVQKDGGQSGKIPVQDMAALVLDGDGIEIGSELLNLCVSQGVAVITSDGKHLPSGVLLPFAGHSLHTSTLREQIAAGVPAQKRVWQNIVRSKISAQADLLKFAGREDRHLRHLAAQVRSGDPDNFEAQAASHYFEELFGDQFYRHRYGHGINSILNYGYAIIRAAVARSIVGAGLHPALGIHHRNQYNPFCLADDAMEPLRPMVDRFAWEIVESDTVPHELYPQVKRKIIGVLGGFVALKGRRYPLLVALDLYAASLRRAICDGENLEVPLPEIR